MFSHSNNGQSFPYGFQPYNHPSQSTTSSSNYCPYCAYSQYYNNYYRYWNNPQHLPPRNIPPPLSHPRINKQYEQEQQDQTEQIEEDTDIQYELTPEALEMFARSEQRRLERKRQQRMDARKAVRKVVKLPDQKETEEINETKQQSETALYGEHSQKIISLEAGLNGVFDRLVDFKQPKLWPSEPLNQQEDS